MLNNHQLQLSHVTLRFHQDQLFTFKTEVIIVIEFKFWAAEGKKKKDLLPFPSKKKKKIIQNIYSESCTRIQCKQKPTDPALRALTVPYK